MFLSGIQSLHIIDLQKGPLPRILNDAVPLNLDLNLKLYLTPISNHPLP